MPTAARRLIVNYNRMKTKYINLFFLLALLSCTEQFNNANSADEISKMDIVVQADVNIPGLPSPEYLNVRMDNFGENLTIESVMDADWKANLNGVIPGLYNINITGKTSLDGASYYLNGSVVNLPIPNQDMQDNGLKISVRALVAGTLIFKEIYYTGSKTPKGTNYFRDQFYDLYNNTENVIYLDNLYFANLTPGTPDVKLPVWPAEDGDKFAYAEKIWQFPGNGTDYPLAPGESCIVSQFAANHRLTIYNPSCPVDGSVSEFEFNCNNANFPDQPAVDMKFIYEDGKNQNTMYQYLTSVFGGAYVIFKVPDGVDYQPHIGTKWQTVDLSSKYSTLFARIPVDYIIDAVEAGATQSDIVKKRVPGFLDSGMTYVGQIYNSKSVSRKLVGTHPDGSPIFQDTNNSSQDFEIQDVPVMRRYNTKMPNWNHTLH